MRQGRAAFIRRIVAAALAAAGGMALPAAPVCASRLSMRPQAIAADLPTTSETVSFGDGSGRSVTVIRGPGRAAPPPSAQGRQVETVRFADPHLAPVTVIRGAAPQDPGFGLFAPAASGELDLVAFAVDGVESSHGTNALMWRPELDGPQGPMQVSAAAAVDVGGGDRFDMRANRLMGRAYLAQMYRRYGDWPDALAAYNWGPGNVDAWIVAGRPEDKLPLETARYIIRVLRDALMIATPL